MKKKDNPKPLASTTKNAKAAEYIVGIGASAGGLEALQEFFKATPLETGLAFVVIQHLSPDYKSLMDELLARHTKLPIKVAKDGMVAEPDKIYLIPPRKNMTLFHGKLLLEDQGLRNGLNLPIDIFFRSLAKDYGKNAVAVVLSGTGSDGALGTRAIKEAGGMVIAQDERTAKFDGMPRSTISTGLVDHILPPSKIPEAIVTYLKHPINDQSKPTNPGLSSSSDNMSKVMMILRDYSGIDFSFYKENTILRRLERRLSINRFDHLDQYLQFLSQNDKEKDILYRELLIGVTRFFRDEEAFASLRDKIIPRLFETRPKNLRVWSVGCSTGEEVYSLAMLLQDYMDANRLNTEVKIFATDIDKRSIELAGQGIYPESVVSDIEMSMLSKYFKRRENGYQVGETIRKMVIFATHNVLKDPPFSKLDLIVCRNLFIYLKAESQSKVLETFQMALKPERFLFMGNSESLGNQADAFETIDSKNKIYARKAGLAAHNSLYQLYPQHLGSLKAAQQNGPASRKETKPDLIFEKIFELLLPPSFVVDENLNLVHIINDINPYVQLKPGKFSQNLSSLGSQELSLLTGNIVRQLKTGRNQVSFEHVRLKPTDDPFVTITGYRLETENDTQLYLIVFHDEILKPAGENQTEFVNLEVQYQDRLSELQNELQFTKENLQATIEELETSNEELQASNEELIASNEELQSTNEELQSVNEELYTVNSEYQKKIEELIQLNADINNLLRNTHVGALYLDRKLCIRKFTENVAILANLLDADIGRPIFHISGARLYPKIFDHIQQVQQDLVTIEEEHLLGDGNLYIVRITPYRGEYNIVEGILITLVNINKIKDEREKLNQSNQRLNAALEMGKMAWWEWDIVTGQVNMHPNKATMLGYTVEEFPTDVYEICKLIHPDDYEPVMQHMRDYLSGNTAEYNIAYRIRCKDDQYKVYHDRGGIVGRTADGKPTKLVGLVIDITQLKK